MRDAQGRCMHEFYRSKSQTKQCLHCGVTIVDGDEESTWRPRPKREDDDQ